jgi:hypothetical protein
MSRRKPNLTPINRNHKQEIRMKIKKTWFRAGGVLLLLNSLTLASIEAATYRVYATREGLVGGQTANGHIIGSRDHFCALPSGTVLNCNGCRNYTVNIRYPGNGRTITGVPVWDIGPWNTKDNYWHAPRAEFGNVPLGLPESQDAYQNGYNGGHDEFGRVVANPAGIDLADGTFWDDLGMVNNDWVEVTYNWEPDCNYLLVGGAIKAHYDALGGCDSFLGGPLIGETGTPDGIGRYNHFANHGSIYWTGAYGAWSIHGLIRDHWQALGWETSALGYPVTDETGTPDGVGRYNHFKNPRLNNQGGSIYWTPALGAHEVHGAIRDFWANQGWERGPLGYPTSDEYAVSVGRRSDFEHGTITFNSTTGQTTSP